MTVRHIAANFLLMPLFTRRRLQSMLDDLSSALGDEKSRDLLRRLEDKRIEQALPAEMELVLLWSIGKTGDLVVEPEWWGDSGRPDAYTEALVPGQPAVIEIAATSDNAISGEEAMDDVAMAIGGYVDRIRRGIRGFLYYRFREEYGYEGRQYFRRRLAPPGYTVSPAAEEKIKNWIVTGDSERVKLRIIEPGLDVEVERTAHKQIRFHDVWSTMPPEAHSLEDNPLYKLLKRKISQLGGAHRETLRFIFLADVGSVLLNRLGRFGEVDSTRRRVSGSEILSHFINTYQSRLDGIVVFAPQRDQYPIVQGVLKWVVVFFGRPGFDKVPEGLNKIAQALPPPRFEGYQARSLFHQGSFSPKARGWYLGMSVESKMNDLKAKVPARALLDLLADRITVEQFRYFMGQRDGEMNLFQRWLDMGMTLSNIDMEPRNVDEDDDHIVLHFKDDPAARMLRIEPSKSDK